MGFTNGDALRIVTNHLLITFINFTKKNRSLTFNTFDYCLLFVQKKDYCLFIVCFNKINVFSIDLITCGQRLCERHVMSVKFFV